MRRILIFSAFLALVSLASAADPAEMQAVENNEEDYISLAGDTKVNDYFQDDDDTFDNYSVDWESYEEGGSKEHLADPNGHSEEGEEEEDSEEDPPKPEDDASVQPDFSLRVLGIESDSASEAPKEQEILSTVSPKNESTVAEFRDPDYYQPDDRAFYDEQAPVVEVEIEISREPAEPKESPVSVNWPAMAPSDDQRVQPETEAPDSGKQEVTSEKSGDSGFLDADFTKAISDWRNWQYSERVAKIRR